LAGRPALASTMYLFGSKLYFLTRACFTLRAVGGEGLHVLERVPLPLHRRVGCGPTPTTARSYWRHEAGHLLEGGATLGR